MSCGRLCRESEGGPTKMYRADRLSVTSTNTRALYQSTATRPAKVAPQKSHSGMEACVIWNIAEKKEFGTDRLCNSVVSLSTHPHTRHLVSFLCFAMNKESPLVASPLSKPVDAHSSDRRLSHSDASKVGLKIASCSVIFSIS